MFWFNSDQMARFIYHNTDNVECYSVLGLLVVSLVRLLVDNHLFGLNCCDVMFGVDCGNYIIYNYYVLLLI